MRFILSTAIAAMMAVSLYAADVAGTWKGNLETQMGSMEVTIAIKTAQPLAGTVSVGEAGSSEMSKAKLEGGKIYFEANVGSGVVTFQGTVTGDEMKLEMTGTTGNKYPVNCKRAK